MPAPRGMLHRCALVAVETPGITTQHQASALIAANSSAASGGEQYLPSRVIDRPEVALGTGSL